MFELLNTFGLTPKKTVRSNGRVSDPSSRDKNIPFYLQRGLSVIAIIVLALLEAQPLLASECTTSACGLTSGSALKQSRMLVRAVTQNYKQALPIGHNMYSSKCNNFIDHNGNFGPWGQQINSYINRDPATRAIFHNAKFDALGAGVNNVCPNFDTLSGDAKGYAIVWLITAVAMKESGCNPSARGPKFDDIPVGLYQMPLSSKCATNNQNNIKCAMDKLRFQLSKLNSYFTGPNKKNKETSYFEPLRIPKSKRNKIIQSYIGSLNICGTN